jgi:hypothetical protein
MSLTLTCQPGREGDELVFPYTIQNTTEAAAWIMEGFVTSAGNIGSPSFVAMGGEEATIGRLIPPLPEDRTILFALTPVARRLEPGQTLASRLVVPLPLVESNAYLPDLPVRRHTMTGLSSVRLAVAVWPATLEGLAALEVSGMARLAGPDLRAHQRLVEARFAVHGLHILRRKDGLGRDPGRGPSPSGGAG